jgi:hypothetical protein
MNLFRKIFGYTYLVNLTSGEIHDTKVNHKNCHLELIKNKKYLRKKEAISILNDTKNFDGCRWCMPKYNKE